MKAMSEKVYLVLQPPTEEDSRSSAKRILDGLKDRFGKVQIPVRVLRKLYPLCQKAGWKLTVSLAQNGSGWTMVNIEPGDTTATHYGLAVDLGSTTVVMDLVDIHCGKVIASHTAVNGQVAFGNEILSRIFYGHEDLEKLAEIHKATVDTFAKLMQELSEKAGFDVHQCPMMVVSGNTTMQHFLLGLDAFTVFMSPYATVTTQAGFVPGWELEIPLEGMVYIVPSKSNYVGGDITSGAVALGLVESEEINVFLDIGTNGELLIGNRDFMVAGAGAAGPALEGEVIRTGMRAEPGAVDAVRIRDDVVELSVIGNIAPKGICGSGIVDMLSELYMEDILDFRGKFLPENSARMEKIDGEWAFRYADDLYFYQSDVDQFIATKAAAYTMIECLLENAGVSPEELDRCFLSGAFAAHSDLEAAITVGIFPDLPRDKYICVPNTSLEGARELLLNRHRLQEAKNLIENMYCVQFASVPDFLVRMQAAKFIPHTDMTRYPSISERLK